MIVRLARRGIITTDSAKRSECCGLPRDEWWLMTPQDAPAGPVLGEDDRRKLAAALAMAQYQGQHVVGYFPAAGDAIEPIVAALLSSAREEGASAALIKEGRRRCPSCEHLIEQHQQDGCWFSVAVGEGSANLICPCGMSAALANHAVELMPVTALDPIGSAREEGAAAERERIAQEIDAMATQAQVERTGWDGTSDAAAMMRERADARSWAFRAAAKIARGSS